VEHAYARSQANLFFTHCKTTKQFQSTIVEKKPTVLQLQNATLN